MIRLDIVRTVFAKELREMLRDRRSLAVMFGLPLVLYPLLAIGIASLGHSKQQQLTDTPARVSVQNAADAPELLARLQREGTGIELKDLPPDFEQSLQRGDLDAVVAVPEKAQARAVAGEPVEITVRLDRSRTVASFVERKVDKVLDDYERWVLEQRLKKYEAPPAVLEPLKSTFVDVASGDKVFGRMLSQMLPLLLLMTGMLGALFPALNATTTERELGTLETLLVTPAGRTELLLAKGALVLLSALLAAGLNMLSMSMVLLKAVSTLEKAPNLTLSPSAMLLSYLAAVPALIFFSVIVLIVGLLARNFREANSFATPVMLLPLASMAIGIAEPIATPAILITPVANTTVIIREVLTGRATFTAFALAFGSSCLYAGIVLSLAARVFSSEQLVNPAWEPVSLKGLRRTKGPRPRRLPPVDAAMALFVVCILLLFYASPDPRAYGLIPHAVVNQLLVILAPTLLFAYLGRWRFVDTFRWRMPAPAWLIGAALLGVGLGPLVQAFSQFQQTFWPQDPEKARAMAEMFVPAIQAHPVLVPLVIGVLAGFCEEMLFRGAIQTPIERRLPPWAAILLTAFLFGAFHFDLNGLPIRTGLGVLLGWLAWRSGSIFPAMLAHFLYDTTVLGIAAWQIRRHGPDSVTPPADGGLHLTSFDLAAMAVGAVLVVVAAIVLRSTMRARTAHGSSTTSSAAASPTS